MTVQNLEQLDGHALKAMFDDYQDQIQTLTENNQQLTEDKHKLEGQVAWLNRQMFGKKSERYIQEDPNQPKLAFMTDGEQEACSDDAQDTEPVEMPTITRRKPSGGRGKRLPIPDDLPRIEKVYDLPEDEKIDPVTGAPLKQIGELVTEQLSFVPGQIRVIRHIRIKYASPSENVIGDTPEVITASRPQEGLPKCLAAPDLLAQIVVSKYADHLPLDRLVKIFRRWGVVLSKSSMCRWVQGVGGLVDPLVQLMKSRMIEHSQVIQTDETPVRQQLPPGSSGGGAGGGSGGTKECRFWPYVGQPQTLGHYVVFDYSQGRGGEHPRKWFSDRGSGETSGGSGGSGGPLFTGGYLQCDGYAGLNGLFDSGGDWRMTRVGCWAHARRKFYDARQSSHKLCNEALGLIQGLYQVESEAKDIGTAQRLGLRRERSLPGVDTFFDWVDKQRSSVLPKSKLGEALTYAANQETSLRVYLESGHLQIDNNACERSLRGIAIGRKNWLFIGSPAGGKAAAQIFSLIGSAKLHDVEPLAYLTDIITRLPASPTSQIEQFLPDVWKKNQGQATTK